jgi:segregation and condensation protein B
VSPDEFPGEKTPVAGPEPVVGQDPAAGADPLVERDPVAGAVPDPEADPAAGADPVVERDPVAGAVPDPEADPAAGADPLVERDPVVGQDSVAGSDPVVERDPVIGADPIAGADPVPGQDPIVGEEEESGAEPEAGDGPDAVADPLPDLTEDWALESALEALLLVMDSPAHEETLADTLGQTVARVTVALRTMAARFTERSSGIDLRRVGEGWRLFTRDTYAPYVEKLLLDGQRSKLTRAALETLAVIAYRQPVTRSRVAAVRGVNVDGVIRTLLARGLIEEAGTDPDTGGTLYVTTELFLERLGLSSLTDLPPIAPLLPEVDTIDDI